MKYLLDVASASPQAGTLWLSKLMDDWRFAACVTDVPLYLDEAWTDDQRQTVITLAEEACARLAKTDFITPKELSTWKVHEEIEISIRGGDLGVLTAPVLEFGQAVVRLLKGTSPAELGDGSLLFGVHSPQDERSD